MAEFEKSSVPPGRGSPEALRFQRTLDVLEAQVAGLRRDLDAGLFKEGDERIQRFQGQLDELAKSDSWALMYW